MEIFMAGEENEWGSGLKDFIAADANRLGLHARLDSILRPAHDLAKHVFKGSGSTVPVSVRVLGEVTGKGGVGNSAYRRLLRVDPPFLKFADIDETRDLACAQRGCPPR